MNMYLLAIESIDPKNISFGESCLIAVVCMAIVFGILAILLAMISLFKFIPAGKAKVAKAPAKVAAAPVARPAIKMSDIKDEDMMVAALVATIDYHEEVKEDVKVVSIKEI